MTETILDALDKQVVASPGSQQLPIEKPHKGDQETLAPSAPGIGLESYNQKEAYPDLFLHVRENYRISDCFHGNAESLSVDNNPMVLVELDNLSYRYGTSLYAVDRVNSTMYGKFSIGYRMILEKATVIPQYQQITEENKYIPVYENTLLGITSLPTPITKSTPVTHASHMPTMRSERDIVQPIASEEARAAYLEKCMKNIGGVHLPSNIPAKVKESGMSIDLEKRIDMYCNEPKEKRRQEKESHKQTLDALRERKKQQPVKEDDKVIYSQIAQNMEKTRDVIQRSMSRASTISAQERQMALTEKEFTMIKQKMDEIDHRLHEMYKNWHAEYGNANTLEECEEKPYLDKYESKYQVLYQLLQQPRLISTHDGASGITPSLAALDAAATLKRKEWIRSESREDLPRQYTNIEGRLTPHTPQSEDMKLEPTLHVTPESSLMDIPTVLEREAMETSSKTAYMDFPCTQVKTRLKETKRLTTLCGTKETSQAEVLSSTKQFFANIPPKIREHSLKCM